MKNIIEKSFGMNIAILQFFGLYPSEKISRARTIRAYVMYIICTILVPSLSILYFLSVKEIDIEKININNFAYLSEAVWDITKLLPLFKSGDRFKKCINYFGHSYFSPKTSYQKQIMDSCIYVCKRNNLIFLVFVLSGTMMFIVKPFFTKDFFPIAIWLPINPKANLNLYYAIYVVVTLSSIIDFLAMLYVALAGTTMSPLTGGMALHAAIQIKILKFNLENLGGDINAIVFSSEKSLVEYPDTYDTIKQCVKHHIAILRFAKEFEDCFSTVIFSQVISTVISVCFCCLQLVIAKSLTLNSILAAVCILALSLQLYFYCYYGTILYEENNTLTTAIYMGNWYEYDIKSRKALIVLMERSKIPLIIKAGKIIDLSVNTFTGVLKKSYSLLALLKNM